MRLRNNDRGYGLVTQLLHWGTAGLIVWMFYLGWTMVELPVSPAKFEAYALHKSLGLTIMALSALRLIWRLANPVPALPENMARWERWLAHGTHAALYGLLFLIPLAGWLYASASATPVNYFGLFTVPDLVAADEALADRLLLVHYLLGNLLLVVLALHVLGALKHQLISRDQVLKRMLLPARD